MENIKKIKIVREVPEVPEVPETKIENSFNEINLLNVSLSFVEMNMINSFLFSTYSKKNKEIQVVNYGTIDKFGILNIGGQFNETEGHWFQINFENDDNEYIAQTYVIFDSMSRSFDSRLAISSKKNVNDLYPLYKKLKKLSFNNSEYVGKCIKITVVESSFKGIEILPYEKNREHELILNDIQIKFMNHFIHRVSKGGTARYLLNGEPGTGKAQPLDAKILTPNGWVRIGEINIGDEVLTPNGNVTKVIGVYPQGIKPIYKITCNDGRVTEACGEHLWEVYGLRKERNNNKLTKVINTLDIKDKIHDKKYKIRLPLVSETINSEDILNDKFTFLQEVFKNNTIINRFSDIIHKTNDYVLAKKIQEIVWSIGGLCVMTEILVPSNEYELKIRYKEPKKILNGLEDKTLYQRPREIKNEVISVEYIGDKEAKCIMIEDERHLYITDDYIVTHNTETIREIIRKMIPNTTFVIPDFYNSSDLNSILEASQIFDNCVVIMDDIDLFIGSREGMSYGSELGQFLSFFDGIKKNKISLLASTNDKRLVDKAAERPGRFNITIDYGFLNDEQIDKVCNIHLPEKWRIKEVYDALKQYIDGKKMKITGAFIYNLADNIREMSGDDNNWVLEDTLLLIKECYRGFYSSQIEKEKSTLGFK
jgi:hypothetical protein